jgi:hypothetical protein
MCYSSYHCFALFYILLLEQELTIQVGKVNRVQVKYGYLSKAGQDNVLDWRRS